MNYVTDAVSQAGQLVATAAERGLTLSDAQIQHYGRYAMIASALYYVALTMKDPVPADAKYAIEAHIPSGFDRSIIASRLAQRHTRQVLEHELGLKSLREALKLETTREGKLSAWSSVLERTLVGIVAEAYVHSLTLSLWSLKNTARVLVFVLRKREAAEEQRRTNPRGGFGGKLKTWWHGGTQGLITDTLMRRMAEQAEKQASPFTSSGLHDDEEDDADVEEGGVYSRYSGYPCDPSPDLDGATDEAGRVLSAASVRGRFSVKHILDAATPRIVACAREAVHDVLANLPDDLKLSMTGSVRGTQLRKVCRRIEARMAATACVPAWLWMPPSTRRAASPAPVQPANGSPSAVAPPLEETALHTNGDDDEEDEDIIDYPSGSTLLQGPDGRPLPLGRRDGGPHRSLLDELGADPSMHQQVTDAEREVEKEGLRREALARAQTVGFFQELIHHDSFAELVHMAAEEQLARVFGEAANLSSVRGYDAASDSAKLLLVAPWLDACRQQMSDADFVVTPYLTLFCEELVRSTCSQNVRA